MPRLSMLSATDIKGLTMATKTETKLKLEAPDVLQPVAPAEAAGLVPLKEGERDQLEEKVDQFVNELAALDALGLEAGLVLDVVVHAVEDHLAGGAGGQQAQAQAREQRLASGHVLGVQLLGEVVGAHDQHREPLGGAGDLLAVQHCLRCLDHGPQLRVFRRTGGLHGSHQLAHLVGGAHLRHDDAVRAGGAGRGEVGVVPLRADPVDADGDLAAPVLARSRCGTGVLARLLLGVGGRRRPRGRG